MRATAGPSGIAPASGVREQEDSSEAPSPETLLSGMPAKDTSTTFDARLPDIFTLPGTF